MPLYKREYFNYLRSIFVVVMFLVTPFSQKMRLM